MTQSCPSELIGLHDPAPLPSLVPLGRLISRTVGRFPTNATLVDLIGHQTGASEMSGVWGRRRVTGGAPANLAVFYVDQLGDGDWSPIRVCELMVGLPDINGLGYRRPRRRMAAAAAHRVPWTPPCL